MIETAKALTSMKLRLMTAEQGGKRRRTSLASLDLRTIFKWRFRSNEEELVCANVDLDYS